MLHQPLGVADRVLKMLKNEVESVGGESRVSGRLHIDEQFQVPAPHLADATLTRHFSDKDLQTCELACFRHLLASMGDQVQKSRHGLDAVIAATPAIRERHRLQRTGHASVIYGFR